MGPYIFVIASLLAIIPILILYKINIEKISENPDKQQTITTKFFIGVALSELIPILLVVVGFANFTNVNNISELYIPGIIIISAIGFSILFIFLQRMFNVDDAHKEATNTFMITAFALVNAVPIVSINALFLMMP